ncbi:MAG: transglycosylase SLT domain-containing protein [Pseudomonadota bacterium]
MQPKTGNRSFLGATVLVTLLSVAAPVFGGGLPAARWDTMDGSADWTQAVVAALDGPASALIETVPRDIERWCPAFERSDPDGRRAFWVGLVSALAGHESTWQPEISDSEGRWHGLLQISPQTAEGYGCDATDADALKDAASNLACGLRIMAETVTRDGVVSEGGAGVAADWAPFADAEKHADMVAWVRAQSYCAE